MAESNLADRLENPAGTGVATGAETGLETGPLTGDVAKTAFTNSVWAKVIKSKLTKKVLKNTLFDFMTDKSITKITYCQILWGITWGSRSSNLGPDLLNGRQ